MYGTEVSWFVPIFDSKLCMCNSLLISHVCFWIQSLNCVLYFAMVCGLGENIPCFDNTNSASDWYFLPNK